MHVFVLDCGGMVSFTQSFVYLGSLLDRNLPGDTKNQIRNASEAFGTLLDLLFSTREGGICSTQAS